MKKSRSHSLHVILAIACLLTGLIAWTPRSQAAFTDDFDSLLAELQSRSVALSNSTDKVEQKQFKAVNKAIKAINKPADSLSDDVKTAGKVTKTILKVFPDEFPTNFARQVTITLAFNNFSSLITNLFSAIQSDVTNALDQLQTTVNALPAGAAKTKAQAAITQAQAALALANNASSFNTFLNALKVALKAINNGQKAAASGGGGGGGGGGSGVSATIIIGGTNDNWVADGGGGAEWVVSSGTLDIGGGRALPTSSFLSVAQCSGFNGQPGPYTLGNDCGSFSTSPPFTLYSIKSGLLQIDTFNTNTLSLSGSFSFTASDGVSTIVVTNGSFNLTNLTVTP